MPRRGTRPGPPALVLGVWGQGESSAENIAALLDDYIDGAGNVTPRFVVPVATDYTTPEITAVVEYAEEKGYEVEAVFTKKPASRALKALLEKCSKEIVALDPITDDERFESTEDAIADHFTKRLGEKPDDAKLLFLWAEDEKGEPDEADQRVLAAVADCGVAALDLAQGLEVLDVAPADGGGDDNGGDGGEPEGKDEPAADGEEPDYDTVKEWPIRRMKSYAKKVAQQDREDSVDDVPTDEEIDEFNKEAVLDYLFPEDDGAKPEPEPEPAKNQSGRSRRTPAADDSGDDGKGVTPRRAREMREQAEAEGTDSTSKNRRKAAAAKPEKPADEPEPAGEGGDGGASGDDALERLVEALEIFADENSSEDEVKDAVRDFADAFADHIINRIAERVNKEPGESAYREEIAPKRPPGKPRKDGATPTRRRTARS